MLSEKDFPGLQHSLARVLSSFHRCFSFNFGNQPKMRGWIAAVNCGTDFSQQL